MVNEDNSKEQVEVTKSNDSESVEKSFQDTVKSGFDTLTEVVQSIAETQKATQETQEDKEASPSPPPLKFATCNLAS